jgi:hypothetical protein
MSMIDPGAEFEIIGWYDGISEALRRSRDGRWKYVSLIAWHREANLRIFGIVAIDDAVAADIRVVSAACLPGAHALERDWSELRGRIASLLTNAKGRAEIRLCEEIDGEAAVVLHVEAQEIAAMMGQEIDEVIDTRRFADLLLRFPALAGRT